jgi:hypothetical protein
MLSSMPEKSCSSILCHDMSCFYFFKISQLVCPKYYHHCLAKPTHRHYGSGLRLPIPTLLLEVETIKSFFIETRVCTKNKSRRLGIFIFWAWNPLIYCRLRVSSAVALNFGAVKALCSALYPYFAREIMFTSTRSFKCLGCKNG